VCGVVTCSFAKPARSTIITWETEENFGSNRKIRNCGFHEGGGGSARMSALQKHLVRIVSQVHDYVQLGVQRNSGNSDCRDVSGSSEELSEGT
jgi:hypothetical protein